MADKHLVQYDDILRFSTACFQAMGTSDEGARIVSEHLSLNNLYGHDSHGMIRIPQYYDATQVEFCNATAVPEILRESDTTAVIEGHRAWGQVAAYQATEMAIAKAKKHGVSAVTLRNCYHLGRAGAFTQQAAQEGFIAQFYCGCFGGSRLAPWGGTEARLSTNPMSIAIPTRGEPVLIDLTTCAMPEGKIRVARNSGAELPLGILLDRDGKDTTNPADLYDGGSILPLGGTLMGHKGYALSLAVELLGSILSGGGPSWPGRYQGNAAFIQVVDPTTLEDRETFYDACEEVFKNMRESPRKEGVEEIFLPGEIETRRELERRQTGIPVDATTFGLLEDTAKTLGVEFDI